MPRKSHICKRCKRPYVTEGTPWCVHVRVTEPLFNVIDSNTVHRGS